jgi:hypothetical protein
LKLNWKIEKEYTWEEFLQVLGPNQVWKGCPYDTKHIYLCIGNSFELFKTKEGIEIPNAGWCYKIPSDEEMLQVRGAIVYPSQAPFTLIKEEVQLQQHNFSKSILGKILDMFK